MGADNKGEYIYILFDRYYNTVIGWSEHRKDLVEYIEKNNKVIFLDKYCCNIRCRRGDFLTIQKLYKVGESKCVSVNGQKE